MILPARFMIGVFSLNEALIIQIQAIPYLELFVHHGIIPQDAKARAPYL